MISLDYDYELICTSADRWKSGRSNQLTAKDLVALAGLRRGELFGLHFDVSKPGTSPHMFLDIGAHNDSETMPLLIRQGRHRTSYHVLAINLHLLAKRLELFPEPVALINNGAYVVPS